MGEKLVNAPVFLTAAQVRHNPILTLDDYAARLQEMFRKMGFPDYKSRVISGFEINASPSGIRVNPQETRQHSYINRAGTSCFVVESSRLYFQVAEYDVFDTFRAAFINGLELLNSVVTLDYIDSVSMRLLDAIVPRDNESLSKYLVNELLGIGKSLEEDSWKVSHSASETVAITDQHKIVVRLLARHGKLTLPPDLNTQGMKLMPRFIDIDDVHAILDSDCAYEMRMDFDLEEVSSRLRLLKDDLRTTFHAAVTKHALDSWS